MAPYSFVEKSAAILAAFLPIHAGWKPRSHRACRWPRFVFAIAGARIPADKIFLAHLSYLHYVVPRLRCEHKILCLPKREPGVNPGLTRSGIGERRLQYGLSGWLIGQAVRHCPARDGKPRS